MIYIKFMLIHMYLTKDIVNECWITGGFCDPISSSIDTLTLYLMYQPHWSVLRRIVHPDPCSRSTGRFLELKSGLFGDCHVGELFCAGGVYSNCGVELLLGETDSHCYSEALHDFACMWTGVV